MQEQSPHRKTALAVGCTAHVVQDGMTATIYVLLPILAQTFGLSYAQVGLFKGVKSLAQAVPEMCSGVVTEWIGEYRVLVIGLLLSGIGYVGLAVAPGSLLVLASLFVIGVGTAFQHAPSSALIVSAYPINSRRGPLGLYNSSGDVGKLLFTGCFSLVIGAGFAWQNISLIYGLAALVTAVSIAIGARVVERTRHDKQVSNEKSSRNDAHLGWGVLNWRFFWTLVVVVFLDTMVQAGVLVFVAFLMLSKGLPLAIATAATVILLMGGVFGKAGCGFLADRLGVRPAFALIQILTAVGLLCVVVAPDWLALLLLFPLGAVVQGSTSITYGFAADLFHPRRMARGYALLYSSASFSSVAGPFVCGLIADAFGIQSAMFAMAIVSVLAIPPIALLPALLQQEAKTA
ncbi:MAG: MFS transporter [Hyphomicrobiaceae bacterium]